MRSRRETDAAYNRAAATGSLRLRPAPLRLALAFLAMVATLDASLPSGRLARAQDDWDAGRQAAKRQEERGFMGMMAPADFDRWVSGGRNPDQLQRTLESRLSLHVDADARLCGLSAAQKEKLELAGHGDIKRFFRSMDELKERFRQMEGQNQEKFNKIATEVHAFQRKMHSDPFGESSLYRKILKQSLDRDQSARYEQGDLERRKFRYEARIEAAMSNLESIIPMRAEQRRQLVKLLLEKTPPPKKFGQYSYYAVLYQMRTMGEAKLRPIFDDAQWQALNRLLERMRGLEQHLRADGLLP